jgi:hypothetical protein
LTDVSQELTAFIITAMIMEAESSSGNIYRYLPEYTARPRRHPSSYSLPWEPEISTRNKNNKKYNLLCLMSYNCKLSGITPNKSAPLLIALPYPNGMIKWIVSKYNVRVVRRQET